MVTIKFKIENAAFEDGQRAAEIARILHELAEMVSATYAQAGRIRLYDANGNRVGFCEIEGDDRS